MIDSLLVFYFRNEDDLSVAFRDCFQRFQIPDLHGCFGVELFSSLSHEFGRIHIGLGRDDFALSESSLLGGAGEGLLEVFA